MKFVANTLMLTLLLSLTVFATDAPAVEPAQELLMVRVNNTFSYTMSALQNAVVKQGYQLIRVQRVDIGLTKSGYKTAEYRIVFFGKIKEIRDLSRKYPTLIPFLPLKIVIYAEGDETILLATNPAKLGSFYPDKSLASYFSRWERDFRAIMRRTKS